MHEQRTPAPHSMQPSVDGATADEVTNKITGDVDGVAPDRLRHGQPVTLMVIGDVTGVHQRTKKKNDEDIKVRTNTITVQEGLAITNEVLSRLPASPTLDDLWRWAMAASRRDLARAAGEEPIGDIGDYLPAEGTE